MLTRNQEKLIRSLHTKKGRKESGLCLLEGEKFIETAGDHVEYTFTNQMTGEYKDLVTTDTPAPIAAVARIPEWTEEAVAAKDLVIVLDGVQDPGNVGAVLRLCLGFDASLILVESADITSPKVIRASAGAMFHVPWMVAKRSEANALIEDLRRPVFRLEKSPSPSPLGSLRSQRKAVLIAGSEGSGIGLNAEGTPIAIAHDDTLESLNVGHALAIAMHAAYASR